MVEADERTAQGQERLVDVHPPLIPDRQPTVPIEPGQRPLYHPPMPAQPLAGFDPLTGDPDTDPPPVQEAPTAGDIVRLVGVQFGGPLAPLTRGLLDRRNRVDQLLEHRAVVAVRARQEAGQRDAATVADHVMFRAWFAAIGGIRADRRAPLFAGTLALSRLARSQSIRPASPRRSSRVWWRRSQTPASCQSRRRRQPVSYTHLTLPTIYSV